LWLGEESKGWAIRKVMGAGAKYKKTMKGKIERKIFIHSK